MCNLQTAQELFCMPLYIAQEVFIGYPPYHLALKICKGLRPKIRCEIPQLLLDLINKCLDIESQNRPTLRFQQMFKEAGFDIYTCHELIEVRKPQRTEVEKATENRHLVVNELIERMHDVYWRVKRG
ncbi:4530_t:CDS:2, partial [Cetraspora pellucida]